MSRIRRALVVGGLSVAVLAGATLPAWATFADRVSVSSTVATATVAAPAGVTVDDRCDAVLDLILLKLIETYHLTVSWSPSTSRGVTGYVVRAHFADGGTQVLARTDAATTSASYEDSRSWLNRSPRLTVTTVTGYGWTAASPQTAVLTC